jgi:hypothetical protein
MRMRLVVVSLAFLSWGSSASAVPILDQVYEPTGDGGFVIGAHQSLAQTFTVGITGTLTSFEVELSRAFDPPAFGVDWELRRLDRPKVLDAPALASGTIGANEVSNPDWAFVSVDLSPFALSVHRGQHYAIVLSSLAVQPPDQGGINPYAWHAGGGFGAGGFDGPGYARGSGFVSHPPLTDEWSRLGRLDLGIRTSVEPSTTVPEPSLALLVVVASAAIVGRHRRLKPKV